MVVANRLASRRHAVLRLVEGRLEVVDLGSRNGTFVNGERVETPRRLRPGDRIQIGSDTLEVLPGGIERDTQKEVLAPQGELGPTDEETGFLRTLDMAEILLESCDATRSLDALARAVIRAVEDALDEAISRRARLGRTDSRRMRVIVRTLASWYPDGRFDEWRRSIEARLGSRVSASVPPGP